MYSYVVYGLSVDSELPLPPLPEARSAIDADVTVSIGAVSPRGLAAPAVSYAKCQIASGQVWLNIPHIARYLVTAGRSITVQPYPGGDERDVRSYLHRAVFSAVLHQRGFLVLQASAVIVAGKALIFCGASGTGKSTLAAALHLQGYLVLGDGLVAVGPGIRAVPGVPHISLWKDALENLGMNYRELERIRKPIEKYSAPTPHVDSDAQVPIGGMYCLDIRNRVNNQAIDLEDINGVARFVLLKNATYRLNFLEGLGLRDAHLHRVTDVAKAARVTMVSRIPVGISAKRVAEMVLLDHSQHKYS